jgi:hypothetical protein
MARPTRATERVSHAAVGVAAAVIIPRFTGKGLSAALIAGVGAAILHVMLDAPLAQAMADHGIQFGH